jgi:hypothetical protein
VQQRGAHVQLPVLQLALGLVGLGRVRGRGWGGWSVVRWVDTRSSPTW